MFPLGIVSITSGIKDLALRGFNPLLFLQRHALGDWGEMSEGDKLQNELALMDGDARIFSVYETPFGKVWIITEHDRSNTIILLPIEY
jgi:hypothetical protein